MKRGNQPNMGMSRMSEDSEPQFVKIPGIYFISRTTEDSKIFNSRSSTLSFTHKRGLSEPKLYTKKIEIGIYYPEE